MDEQRRPVRFQAREHRAQASGRVNACKRARGQRQSHAAEREQAIDVVGVCPVERDRAPYAKRTIQRQRPRVVGVDQR